MANAPLRQRILLSTTHVREIAVQLAAMKPAISLAIILAACAAKPPAAPPTALAEALSAASPGPAYRGVNLDAADFGQSVPGTLGRDYTWPTAAEVDYFVGKGMNSFRVGFRWERVQHTAKGELDATYVAALEKLTTYATAKGALVVLNPQNFARYYSAVAPADVFADFWRRLAERFRGNPRVAFGLMNEPNTMPTEQWAATASAGIAAIRAAGAKNLILVPGNAWTGAHSWSDTWYGTSNAVAMLAVTDENFAIEVHDYLDADASGGGSECVDSSVGSRRLKNVVEWARANRRRVWLGELGAPATATCRAAASDLLSYIGANADVVLGWAWWSAGPWWGSYPLSIEPAPGDRPQMTWLSSFLPAAMPAPLPAGGCP